MTIYRPTTNAVYGAALTTPEAAYDNNTTTAATGTQSDTSNMGATYSGFASLTGVTALTVYLVGSITTKDLADENGQIVGGSQATLQYSYDGGTSWQTIGYWSGSGGALSDGTYAMSAVTNLPTNLSSVQFRIFISGAAYSYRDDAGHLVTLRAPVSINIKELYVNAAAGYTPSLGTVDRGTTPTPLYMPSLFNSGNGTQGTVGTTPVAIGSGVGQIPFFLGGNQG
jgi:hypothetical protein